MDLAEAAVLLRCFEQSLRVRSVDNCYRFAPVRIVLPGREGGRE